MTIVPHPQRSSADGSRSIGLDLPISLIFQSDCAHYFDLGLPFHSIDRSREFLSELPQRPRNELEESTSCSGEKSAPAAVSLTTTRTLDPSAKSQRSHVSYGDSAWPRPSTAIATLYLICPSGRLAQAALEPSLPILINCTRRFSAAAGWPGSSNCSSPRPTA